VKKISKFIGGFKIILKYFHKLFIINTPIKNYLPNSFRLVYLENKMIYLIKNKQLRGAFWWFWGWTTGVKRLILYIE